MHNSRRVDANRVADLIGDLHSDSFQVRTKASRGLEDLRDCVEPALRKKLTEPVPLEAIRRLEQVLERIDQWWATQPRLVRAVAVLENSGTPEARDILRRLSQSDASPRLAEEAKNALLRLK